MGSVLNTLLLAYRKEQDEKYAQVKSRQGREVDGRKRKPSDATSADPEAAAEAASAGAETPSGGPPKTMRLVLKVKGPGSSPAAPPAANPFAAAGAGDGAFDL